MAFWPGYLPLRSNALLGQRPTTLQRARGRSRVRACAEGAAVPRDRAWCASKQWPTTGSGDEAILKARRRANAMEPCVYPRAAGYVNQTSPGEFLICKVYPKLSPNLQGVSSCILSRWNQAEKCTGEGWHLAHGGGLAWHDLCARVAWREHSVSRPICACGVGGQNRSGCG